MRKETIVAVLGAGNMGTAIAQVVAKNGYEVLLWNHESDPEPLKQIREFRENKKYSPGILLSDNIHPESDLAKALAKASVVFFVLPSAHMEAMVKRAAPLIIKKAICVDVSKGLDEKSLSIIPNLIGKNIPSRTQASVATISGPAIANDMAKGYFTAMNLACREISVAKKIMKIMESENLKLVYTKDVTGVEITGSFKNVYAVAMGICDGLGLPMNTKAALLVCALKEIGALVKKMGGREETVYDLAGLGDIIATGLCAISRNRRYGEALAHGNGAFEAMKLVGQTVEGIGASRVLRALGKKYKIKMPFAEAIYMCVVEKKISAREAASRFLQSVGK